MKSKEQVFMFDSSEYPVSSECYDPANKKVLGEMKEEFKRKLISEFVGLKSGEDKEVSKAKGVNKKVRHKEFVDVLFNKKVMRHHVYRIQSKMHRLST